MPVSNALRKPAYYDHLPEPERRLHPKKQSVRALGQLIAMMPAVRARAEAARRGERYQTPQYARELKALRRFYGDALKTAYGQMRRAKRADGGGVSMIQIQPPTMRAR